jgi:hypothetical protein
MCKKFSAGGYFVLFLFLLLIGGCQVAGGGFRRYSPPEKIVCDRPWDITIVYSITMPDPKERYGKLSERWKDVTVHIRDSSDSNFIAVPVVLQSANPKTGESCFKVTMKPVSCGSYIKYVEYYIDYMFDNNYSGTRLYRVPVSRN